MAITNIAAVMNGIMSPKLMLLVFGIIPERDVIVVQSPFQLGNTFSRKSVMFGRITAIPITAAGGHKWVPTQRQLDALHNEAKRFGIPTYEYRAREEGVHRILGQSANETG